MSAKNILLVCNLIIGSFCGCVENSQVKNVEVQGKDSVSGGNVEMECPEDSFSHVTGCDVKFLNCESNDGFNPDDIKICLTKEEERIVRIVEKKYNRRLFENAEYAPEYYTESVEDFQNYMSISLKVLSKLLEIHGYKTPDEETFYKKIQDIFGEDYHEFYKSPDFLTSITDHEMVKENFTVLEYEHHISTKYRMVSFTNYLSTKILTFEKKIASRDTFGLEYVRYDENSDIIVDVKSLKRDIYANLYVFNDSKAAKVWLMANDLEFFDEICCYEDREVNSKKLKNYLNLVPDDYETYDVSKDESLARHLWRGQDIFNLVFEKTDSAILAYEADNSNKMDIKAFDLLYMYLDKYRTEKCRRTDPKFVKKICLFSKMEVKLNKKHANVETYGYFNFVCQSRASSLLDDELLQLAKKENYFNIESFDEVLRVLKWDNVSHDDPDSDYPAGCLPFDYTTLLP